MKLLRIGAYVRPNGQRTWGPQIGSGSWAAEVVEEALGADAGSVLSEAVRLIELRVRLQ